MLHRPVRDDEVDGTVLNGPVRSLDKPKLIQSGVRFPDGVKVDPEDVLRLTLVDTEQLFELAHRVRMRTPPAPYIQHQELRFQQRTHAAVKANGPIDVTEVTEPTLGIKPFVIVTHKIWLKRG